MTDLVGFLRARLDEDERLAKEAAKEAYATEWSASELGDSVYAADTGCPIVCGPYDYLSEELKAYLTKNDPARVLAEVEAQTRHFGDTRTVRLRRPRCTSLLGLQSRVPVPVRDPSRVSTPLRQSPGL